MLEIRTRQVRFRVRDLVLFRSLLLDDQQRRFAGSKLDVVNLSNFAIAVELALPHPSGVTGDIRISRQGPAERDGGFFF